MVKSSLFSIYFLPFLLGGLSSCFLIKDESVKSVRCTVLNAEYKAPPRLSQTCLYRDITSFRVSEDLHKFTPNFQLWSDGAHKSRWVYLPANTQINSDNPDQWVFAVGTQFFKEFRKKITRQNGDEHEIKVETRHLIKIKEGKGIDAWSLVAYAWQENQQDAQLVLKGAKHVLATNHNIPSQEDCVTCHKGNTDIILGFDAIQLSDLQGKNSFGHGPSRKSNEWTLQSLLDDKRLTKSIKQPMLPGNPLEQRVLGYLHANCGNCHNPMGHAADQEAGHLKLRHELKFKNLAETHVYQTAVNQVTQNFTLVPYIVMGAKHEEMALFNSALFVRINSLDEEYRMPMLARETTDYSAVALMHQWMLTLPTPQEHDFGFDNTQLKTKLKPKKLQTRPSLVPLKFTHKKGLQVNLELNPQHAVPAVMIMYWPEDKSLQEKAVMDHFDGDFTEKLIVGSKGSAMSLRNSDDVGHTIYVKDKRRNVKWQLSYMPPGSAFEKDIFWDEDIFVEMRCRLHLYMSAWVGSINSRFYKIVELKQGQYQYQFEMTDFPEKYQKLKVWMPKMEDIDTTIAIGQQQTFDLKVGAQVKGSISLKRLAQ